MLDKFKKMELRDDGFLEVTLKKLKDFDDYVFQQIQKDGSCLGCVRDHRQKSKFYFDTKGYLTLHDYLHSRVFEHDDLLSFLIYVLEDLVKVNASKPVSLQLDHIFLGYDGGSLRFLVFPVTMDNWVFTGEDVRIFVDKLIEAIRICDGYEVIGLLSYARKQEEISLPMILQELHDLEVKYAPRLTIWERIFHRQKEEPYRVKDMPIPVSYPEMSPSLQIREDTSDFAVHDGKEQLDYATVVLFEEDESMFSLQDLDTDEVIMINRDTFTIGRSKENAMTIPQSYISGFHAVIKHKDMLEDLHSSNGTRVNGEAITEIKLNHDDIISFAKKSYQYKERKLHV